MWREKADHQPVYFSWQPRKAKSNGLNALRKNYSLLSVFQQPLKPALRSQREPEKAERRISLLDHARKFQISYSLGEFALPQVLDDHAPLRGN